MIEPTAVVLGIGAVAVPAGPPLAVVYQSKPVPVAVSAVAVEFWQYVSGEVTVGAGVLATTDTVIGALGLSQPLTVWLT